METTQHRNMNTTNASLSSSTSPSYHETMIIHTTSLATIDVSAEDNVNMIESDENTENCTTGTAAMELTPYPYTPTSEELADFYQLEQSLGEDWSFRLACELSCAAVSMDDDDDDCAYSRHDDSVTFFDEHQHFEENLTSALPEDIEVRTYVRRENLFDDTVTPIESFSKYESF